MIIKHKFNTAFLILLSLGLITAVAVIALLNKTLPLLTAKALYFCQQLISNTLFARPNLPPNIIVFALVPILIMGILSFLVQLYKTYNLQKGLYLKIVKLPKRISKIVAALYLENKVYLIEDTNLFSFCSGILNQRIIITTSLAGSLNGKELEAVLLHEQAHLKHFDPVKVLFGKTISSMFFFLPIFAELNKNMIATNEILADNWAIKTQNGSTFLRSAIRKIIATPPVNFSTVSAIASDSLEIRIHRLVNPAAKHKFSLSLASILSSVLFTLLSWFLLQTPVSAFSLQRQEEQCQYNAQMLPLSFPENLFSSQAPKDQL